MGGAGVGWDHEPGVSIQLDRLVPTLGREVHVALKVKQLREERGWSQEELARRMTAAGMSIHQSAISKIEKTGGGRRSISLDEAVAFAHTFALTLTELLLPDGSREEVRALQAFADGPSLEQQAHLANMELARARHLVLERMLEDQGWVRRVTDAVAVYLERNDLRHDDEWDSYALGFFKSLMRDFNARQAGRDG